jgi:signal transduction histidine kinase
MIQLFQNLLANALKFSSKGGAPRVRIFSRNGCEASCEPGGSRNGCLEVLVEDNGIGFDEKHADRIFAPFQRLHGRGEYEGTGMGLAICKRIVERHGGTITAQSAPGKGATFVIVFPPESLEGGSEKR